MTTPPDKSRAGEAVGLGFGSVVTAEGRFTDQKRHVATAETIKKPWGFGKNGSRFRCYLCGHKFEVGDGYRWIYAGGRRVTNLMVCDSCDGPDVLDRWIAANLELKRRFWWAFHEE